MARQQALATISAGTCSPTVSVRRGDQGFKPEPLISNQKLKPLDVKFKAVFGSDIGHWDVPDMATVLVEAYKLVEGGLLSKATARL
ncbi:MAG: hypothetical protein KUG71_12025 [Porticoccaceae bacterium]|nr:hypothetical protein [Porticoccaceae bacterium]